MTKSQESGENEITREAKQEARRTGEDVCAILRRMLSDARAAGDVIRARKIIRAEKYLGCRNAQRRSRS